MFVTKFVHCETDLAELPMSNGSFEQVVVLYVCLEGTVEQDELSYGFIRLEVEGADLVLDRGVGGRELDRGTAGIGRDHFCYCFLRPANTHIIARWIETVLAILRYRVN